MTKELLTQQPNEARNMLRANKLETAKCRLGRQGVE